MTDDSTLQTLPLFPLGSVLFPGGLLPLRIFEVRYLDMIGRCHKAGAPFGVVGLIEGSEVQVAGAGAERFALVGTLATIQQFSTPQPGLMQVECVGTQRFRIDQSTRQKHGLWTADVTMQLDDQPLPVPPDLAFCAVAMERLIETLEQRRADVGDDELGLPFVPPYQTDDCGWLANRWCELLPLPAAQKQSLLALDSPLMRLELVGDVLTRTGMAE